MKHLYRLLGLFFVALGFLGAFLPILPTTPFLLLALWLFSRSSDKLRHWLLTNRMCGKYISDYHNGHGIPKRVKFYTLALLWATITYSAVWVVGILWVKVLLFAIAIGVSIHILRFKTKKNKKIVILFPTETELSAMPDIPNCEAEALVSGVGMAETAATVSRIARTCKPDMVILAGIAGAYTGSGLTYGDCVIVKSERVSDLGAVRDGRFTPLYQKTYFSSSIPEAWPLKKVDSATISMAGNPVLGQSIDSTQDEPGRELPSIENMEGASFFSTSLQFGLNFVEVRAVSNMTDDNRDDWQIEKALESLSSGIKELLEQYNGS